MLRLRISPKEALIKIDKLLSRGDKLWGIIEAISASKQGKDEKILSRDFQELGFEYKQNSADALTISKDLSLKIFHWYNDTYDQLSSVFSDHTPLYSFKTAGNNLLTINLQGKNNFQDVAKNLKAKLDVLKDFYNALLSYFRSSYLADQGLLCYYDMVCQISGKNQRDVCAFMFEQDIGKVCQFTDIYEFMTGESQEEQHKWPKNWQRQLINAVDEINAKVNGPFCFNIFSREKNTLVINTPKGMLLS